MTIYFIPSRYIQGQSLAPGHFSSIHKERIVLGIKTWKMPSALIDKHLRAKIKMKPTIATTAHLIGRNKSVNRMLEFWWSICHRKHHCCPCGLVHGNQ